MPPRKKKGKKQVVEKPVSKGSPLVSEAVDKETWNVTKKWLENVKKAGEYQYAPEDLMEINSDEESDEFECNLKELEKPLKTLLKNIPDYSIRKKVQIECEWDKCGFETTDTRSYNNHVHDHLVPLTETQLTCLWNLCKFETQDRTELLRHLDFHAYHTRLKTFGLGLVNVLSIPNCMADSKFRNIIPELPNDYFCYWSDCSKSYTKFNEYIEHVNYHIKLDYETGNSMERKTQGLLKDIPVTCKWDSCEKVLPHVFQLKRHLRTHTKERLIGCANCGSLYSSKSFFVDHCMRQVVNQRSFQCPDCFKNYPSEKLLKDHTRAHIHKIQCSICGLSWQKKSLLARHIRYKHMDHKPLKCDECDYRGKTQHDIDSHSRVHKQGDDSRYKCEVFQCDYSSRTLMALKRHDAKIHLGQPQIYQCHCCSKEYQRGYLLSKHLVKDHAFKLAPGHSRFLYKLDYDGFYRLQTKRVEDLKETNVPMREVEDSNLEISYEVHKIVGNQITMKKVMRTVFIEEPAEDSKDINDFAMVKNYIKKKRATEK